MSPQHSAQSVHRLSCVVPAHNEGEGLVATLTELARTLARLTHEYELIVIDDGSTDNTAALLKQLCQELPLIVITHPTNLGYAAALRSGFASATMPLVFFTDSDGQFVPDDLALLLAHIDRSDIVVGYRQARQDPWPRLMLSRGFNALVRWALGIRLRDINCAFKLFHRETLRTLTLEAADFSINAEIALEARRAGLRVIEVGVRHRRRRTGRSSVRPWHVLTSTRDVVLLLLRRMRRLPDRRLVTTSGTKEEPPR